MYLLTLRRHAVDRDDRLVQVTMPWDEVAYVIALEHVSESLSSSSIQRCIDPPIADDTSDDDQVSTREGDLGHLADEGRTTTDAGKEGRHFTDEGQDTTECTKYRDFASYVKLVSARPDSCVHGPV